MPGFWGLHKAKPHGSGCPAGGQLQRDIAGGEQALSLRIPDLENIAWALKLGTFRPTVEIDPIAQGPLPSKIEVRRLQRQNLRQTDLKISHCVAIDVAGQHAAVELQLPGLGREVMAADEREGLVS